MKRKTRKILRMLLVMVIIIFMLVNFDVVNAVSNQQTTNLFNWIGQTYSLMSKNEQLYKGLGNLTTSLNGIQSVEQVKIKTIGEVGKLEQEYKDTITSPIILSRFLNQTVFASNETTASGTVQQMQNIIKGISGDLTLAIKSLKPNKVVNIEANTAGKLAGQEYNVKLSGNIYYAKVDANGNTTSNKWVVLVHGFLMNGQAMADAVGHMYLEQGYNVLAPDLRGFGNSEGSVAMGYLESLDIWDWLTYINQNYVNKCDGIIVHGTSLGGATTVFLSGLQVEGQDITHKKVIGLIEDCGYSSMTGIIKDMISVYGDNVLVSQILGIFDKTTLAEIVGDNLGEEAIKNVIINVIKVGLTQENFDTLQNGLNSLKNCKVPLLVIHGTADSTVPVKNSTEIYNAAKANANIPYVQKFIAQGEEHAFVMVGNQYESYEEHVHYFAEKVETIAAGNSAGDKESTYQPGQTNNNSALSSMIRILKLVKNMMNIG